MGTLLPADVGPALLDALERSDPLFAGEGSLVAAVLVVAVALTVAPRSLARAPLLLLALHLGFVGSLAAIPRASAFEPAVRVCAAGFMLASMARSVFLLLVDSLWMRRVLRPLPRILRDVIQGFIFLVALGGVLREAGVEPASLLGASALLTAVVGLSLQDTLGNLFAGLAIHAQEPFSVGDWVQFDAPSGVVGRITETNWRATRVLTLDQTEVTIPNGVVAKSAIVNYSRPTPLVRREVEVHAPYEASPAAVRRALLPGLDHVPEVLREPPPGVFTRGFTERGVNYVVRYFIDEFQDRELVDSQVRERIWYAMSRAGLAIPTPGRTVRTLDPDAARTQPRRAPATVPELLAQIPLFRELSAGSIAELAAQCDRRHYTTEEVIVRAGDTSTEMFLVESGSARMEVTDTNGRAHLVTNLSPGEFFGEMSLMTGEPRAADVIAYEETVVLVLGRDAIVPLFDRHPNLAEHMSRVLAERRLLLDELALPESTDGRPSLHDELEILGKIRRFFGR